MNKFLLCLLLSIPLVGCTKEREKVQKIDEKLTSIIESRSKTITIDEFVTSRGDFCVIASYKQGVSMQCEFKQAKDKKEE